MVPGEPGGLDRIPNGEMTGVGADFLTGGGEMGARIRAFDWAAHPLGLPEQWPPALRTVVRLMLTTQHPTVIFWGPALHCLYNDALAQSLGPERHPALLGAPAREALADSWAIVGADLESVLAGEGSVFREDQPVTVPRRGRPEAVYWTYSFSPIDSLADGAVAAHTDGSAAIGGVLALCTETTGRVREHARRAAERDRQHRMFEQAPGFIMVTRGPAHLVEFVNDAHRALFGSEEWVGRTLRGAFPGLEGQDFVEQIDRVFETGESYTAEGVAVHYRRTAGGPEETRYLSFIFAPVHDDGGRVSGVFCEGFDVTGIRQAERRHAVLAELGDRLRELDDPEAIAFAAAETLGRALDVSRAGYGTIDKAAETITIGRDWNAPGVQTLSGVLHFRDYGSYIEDLKAGRTVVVPDARLDPRTAATAASLEGITARAFVNMPVTEQGGFVALLFLNHAETRSWTQEELALIRDVAERTRTSVERRRAEQALRVNEARLRFLDALGSATAEARDADAVMAVTTRMLGEHLAVSDCAYADMEADQDMFNIRGDWHVPGMASIVGRYSLTSFGSLAVANLRAGKPLIVNDNVAELGDDGARAFLDIGIRATLCMPFVKEGRLTALMAIHHARPHRWSEAELGLLREVTDQSWAHIERVRAEAALRESEARLRLAMEGARIGTWDWDLEARQGSMSARTAAMIGADPDAPVTRDLIFRLLHPDDRDWVAAAYRRSIDSGEAFSAEYRLCREDGALCWISARGVVQKDERGRAKRITGTVRDVTARRRAQEALHALNETLEQQVARRTAERDRMWRLSGDVFLVIGLRWDVRALNPAVTALLGYTPEEVLGDRFSRYFHPDDLRAVSEGIRAAARGPVRDVIGRVRAKDGRWRHFAWSAAPAEGEAYVIGRDVTEELEQRAELERAQDALRQAQKVESLGQLTGGVAHDFNNLLTPIIGGLDLLRRGAGTGPREQRLIGGALESAERARTLVQRLLAFARRQPLQPGPVDLAELILGMQALIESTCGPQIDVVVSVEEGLPPALADPNQIEMAILNLSVNSRDAMPDGGRLTLTARREAVERDHASGLAPGAYVSLSVADTGCGMDADTMARAIEPFFSTKGIGKGTGLGLSMVHGLALQLGGSMQLQSIPEMGTRVELLLPVANGAAEVRSSGPVGQQSEASGLVLLVDDEPSVRASTAALLADLGYSVKEVESGRDALAYLDAAHADYVVTDHLMPSMTGSELAERVRQRFPAMPVLIVSGYAELDGISPDLPRLAKPFRQDELAASMAALDAKGGHLPAKARRT
ncbi:PAS domain S-box protein [Sphingomonas sp. S2-65]|uniref:PAS domain S-box protein n=1 Tax=Sphingomonas sp. S2-65 TaxID=2903960 RepID=UPI001F2F7FC8|nr:PAS domain S-box protein [Sphingomonas sp. S2-65]UYY59729.1 PAS domain S-box protein [Sphingomonas sp. S2-65]